MNIAYSMASPRTPAVPINLPRYSLIMTNDTEGVTMLCLPGVQAVEVTSGPKQHVALTMLRELDSVELFDIQRLLPEIIRTVEAEQRREADRVMTSGAPIQDRFA